MEIVELVNAAAGILFSTACTGTCVILVITILNKILKIDKLDSTIIKLLIAFMVIWVIDIVLYIYLVITT